MNGEEQKKESETIFFLGAGVSVPAGVPDTKQFIYGEQGFIEYINRSGTENEKKVLETLIEKLEGKLGSEQVDLEKVFETLIDLTNVNDNIVTEFFEEKKPTFTKEDLEDLGHLEEHLRKFIREMTIVSDDKIEYLEPLRYFAPLKVYSVNYDTCIEQFCKKYSLLYTDGFELYWHPEFFKNDEYRVKHYKLHGSVMWWKTDRNTYVKIPIKPPVENIELITGEIAKNVIVYPAPGKMDYSRPLLDLQLMLYGDLTQARECIVVGYTFRDESIKQIFFEAAQENNDLLVVLISPSAARTYEKQLRSRGSSGGLSSLGERVICFNYPIETVLSTGYLLKSLRVIEEIRSTFEKGEEYKREEIGGWIHQYADCVLKCAEIGYVEKAKTILERYLGLKLEDVDKSKVFRNFEEKFRLFYMMGISLLLNGRYLEAAEYLKKMNSLLRNSFDIGRGIVETAIELRELRGQLKQKSDGVPVASNGEEELRSNIQAKENELRRLRGELEYRYSLFWCVHDSQWGRENFQGWVKFLETQVDLLGSTRKDLTSEHLNPILDASRKVWETINERQYIERLGPQDVVEIDGFKIEMERKEKSEEYFALVLDRIQELIDFLNLKEKIKTR